MRRFFLLAAIFAMAIVSFFSCNNGNDLRYIPKDAFLVGVYDGARMNQFADPELIEEQMGPYMNDLKAYSPHLAELFHKFMYDYNALGILFKKKSFIFMSLPEENNATLGFIVPIKKKKLEENIDLIAGDFEIEPSLFFKEKNGIKYYEFSGEAVIGWNDDVLIAIMNKNASFGLLEKHMNFKKEESIAKNKDFKSFYKECKHLNLWMSSDIVEKIDEANEFAVEFKRLSGIDIANNYGHVHLEVKMDEVVVVSKLKFNKSIQKADRRKLYENSAEISKLLSKPLNYIMEIIDGNNPYNDYYYYEEYDDDMEDYENFSEEEWEEFLK